MDQFQSLQQKSAISTQPSNSSMMQGPAPHSQFESLQAPPQGQTPEELSALRDVFKIYSSPENMRQSGLYNGGLDVGMDLTQLAISFESKENLVDKLKSPYPYPIPQQQQSNNNQNNMQGHQQAMYSSYSESFQMDFRIPQCYTLSKNKQDGVKEDMVRNVLPDRVLMYIFYNMPNDRYQLVAAETLTSKGWTYVPEEMRWVRMRTYGGQQRFTRFNPETWQEEPLV